MPEIGKDVALVLRLYFRCVNLKSLPYDGGVMDQPAWIMDLFDVIDEQKDQQASRERELAERDAKVRELRANQGGRKHA